MIHFNEASAIVRRHYWIDDPRYKFDGMIDLTLADWPVSEVGDVEHIEAKRLSEPDKDWFLFGFPLFEGGIGMFVMDLKPDEIVIERVADDATVEAIEEKRNGVQP